MVLIYTRAKRRSIRSARAGNCHALMTIYRLNTMQATSIGHRLRRHDASDSDHICPFTSLHKAVLKSQCSACLRRLDVSPKTADQRVLSSFIRRSNLPWTFRPVGRRRQPGPLPAVAGWLATDIRTEEIMRRPH